MGHSAAQRSRASGSAPLSGLAVLLGEGELASAARARLATAGAWCLPMPESGASALAAAIGRPGVKAVLRLDGASLPVRPPSEIAAYLFDGREHASIQSGGCWCVTVACARHLLPLLQGEGLGLDDVPGLVALSPFAAAMAPAPGYQGAGRPLRAADLPSVFGSGLPFAGPFNPQLDAAALDRALAAATPRKSAAPPLPDGLTPLGSPPRPAKGEVIAVLVARNEALRLPAALRHLRALGVPRVVVIDNDSSDETPEIARSAGADLIHAPGSYAESGYGIAWANAVLDRWGRGHWALVVDADELLVYPGADRASLPELCAHLDTLGAEALRTLMLDFFPEGPLGECDFRPGDDLIAGAPLFEPPRVREEQVEHFPHTLAYGGVRERLFFPEADPTRPSRWLTQRLYNLGWRLPQLRQQDWFRRMAPSRSPTLTKIPLLRWREGAALITSTHLTAPMTMVPGQPTGALLHFKFLQDFHARAVDAVTRSAHYDGSKEYLRYLAKLEAEPRFALAGPRSLRYAGPDQLVRLGLMQDTPAWRAARGAA